MLVEAPPGSLPSQSEWDATEVGYASAWAAEACLADRAWDGAGGVLDSAAFGASAPLGG